MPKKLLEDIKVRTRIHKKEPDREAVSQKVSSEEKPVRAAILGIPHGETKGRTRALWVIAALCLFVFLFSISYLFLNATVTIDPKIEKVALNENLSGSKDGSTGIPFDLVVISDEENKSVRTTEERDISEKARGIVFIYNAFSAAPQTLRVDTRLEGSNGKIYKTEKPITVPGMKGSTPGSVLVGIYGEEAGEEYNSGPLDFKILGFKGTSKYDKFYARSNINDAATKGEISGGLKDKLPFFSESDKAVAFGEMEAALRSKLVRKAGDQLPEGVVLFEGAAFVNADERVVDYAKAEGEMLPLAVKGTLYGFLFNEARLTKKIAEDTVAGYGGESVYITHIRDLDFSLSNKDAVSFASVRNINFNISGPGEVVWKLDEMKLIGDLLGKSKKEFNQTLLRYPNIESAQSVIIPFWRRSFPDKIKDIKLIVNYPK